MCKPLLMPASGLFSHIALHKKVLYAAGEDGIICQLVIKGDHALMTATQSIGSPVTSLSFNPSHHKLAISCSMVSCSFSLPCIVVQHHKFTLGSHIHTHTHMNGSTPRYLSDDCHLASDVGRHLMFPPVWSRLLTQVLVIGPSKSLDPDSGAVCRLHCVNLTQQSVSSRNC